MKFIKIALCAALVSGTLVFSSSLTAQPEATTESPQELNATIHELETLFVLMQERLALMHDMARYKWNHNQNLETVKGELIDTHHDNPAVSAFLNAQNEAAQELQKIDFESFKKENITQFENIKDLNSDLLPQLKLLNSKISSTAQELMSQMNNEALPDCIKDISFTSFKQEGVDRSVYETAVDPLFQH